MNVIVRPAGLQDIDLILGWREARTAWLRMRGLDQWANALPREAVAATVEAGCTWMGVVADEPVGTITVTTWEQESSLWIPDRAAAPLWAPADEPGSALYVSKMIVPGHAAGHDFGGQLLDWAGERAAGLGFRQLRLDAWTTNLDLHAYYLAHGFELVRIVSSRSSGACFQRCC